jgi:hypothetical protein
MLSPRSQPYFERAIIQSGSATAPWAVENKQVLFLGENINNATGQGQFNERDYSSKFLPSFLPINLSSGCPPSCHYSLW